MSEYFKQEAEKICKTLNLDISIYPTYIEYLESVLKRVAQAAVDYETEQGYFSTVVADAELEAEERERERIKKLITDAGLELARRNDIEGLAMLRCIPLIDGKD